MTDHRSLPTTPWPLTSGLWPLAAAFCFLLSFCGALVRTRRLYHGQTESFHPATRPPHKQSQAVISSRKHSQAVIKKTSEKLPKRLATFSAGPTNSSRTLTKPLPHRPPRHFPQTRTTHHPPVRGSGFEVRRSMFEVCYRLPSHASHSSPPRARHHLSPLHDRQRNKNPLSIAGERVYKRTSARFPAPPRGYVAAILSSASPCRSAVFRRPAFFDPLFSQPFTSGQTK